MAVQLTDEQTAFYEGLTERMRREMEDIQSDIERELGEVKERITELNTLKQHARLVYDGATARLGRENEFARAEEEEGGNSRNVLGGFDDEDF